MTWQKVASAKKEIKTAKWKCIVREDGEPHLNEVYV
jgi:hypothetical protein